MYSVLQKEKKNGLFTSVFLKTKTKTPGSCDLVQKIVYVFSFLQFNSGFRLPSLSGNESSKSFPLGNYNEFSGQSFLLLLDRRRALTLTECISQARFQYKAQPPPLMPFCLQIQNLLDDLDAEWASGVQILPPLLLFFFVTSAKTSQEKGKDDEK